MNLPDPNLHAIVDLLGPGGTAVSLATTLLLTIRFVAFVLQVIMWFFQRRDAIREGRPSLPPPMLPPSLGLVLLFVGGAALAMTRPAARLVAAYSGIPPIFVSGLQEVAANAETPPKKSKEPKKGCGVGCTGTPPNCRCTGKADTQTTKISGVPTSILGDDCQPWSIEPLYTGPGRPSS